MALQYTSPVRLIGSWQPTTAVQAQRWLDTGMCSTCFLMTTIASNLKGKMPGKGTACVWARCLVFTPGRGGVLAPRKKHMAPAGSSAALPQWHAVSGRTWFWDLDLWLTQTGILKTPTVTHTPEHTQNTSYLQRDGQGQKPVLVLAA